MNNNKCFEYGDVRPIGKTTKEAAIDRKSIFSEYPDLVTSEQLAQMLGIGRNSALQLLRRKKIISFRIGNIYKIPKACVIDFVADNVENERKDCNDYRFGSAKER